jgi:galactoside O-acetyltransferase
VSIIGGGEFVLEDFAGLSAGCRVITGTDDYRGPYLTNPTIPREFTNYTVSHVTIREHAIVGTNVVIFPGVTIGEGAAVSAGTVVRRDLPGWGVYVGEPLRKIAERDRDAILEKRRTFLEQFAARSVLSPADPTPGRVQGLEDAGAWHAFRLSTE